MLAPLYLALVLSAGQTAAQGTADRVAEESVPAAQSRVIHVPLEYRAPGEGPKPNFSPIGTKVTLTPVDREDTLPAGASRPARSGTIQIGPDAQSWIRLLVTADPAHPKDF